MTPCRRSAIAKLARLAQTGDEREIRYYLGELVAEAHLGGDGFPVLGADDTDERLLN